MVTTGAGQVTGERKRLSHGVAAAGQRLLGCANAVARAVLWDGKGFVSLVPDALLEKSWRLTGLDDFGEPLLGPPLEILMRSFEEDARLNLVGRMTVRKEMVRLLCNRLLMKRDRNRNPGIAEQEIRTPLFITGLPRSGTTMLHALLACDPASRAPLVWEVLHPSPPPEAARRESDPRIERVQRQLAWLDVLMPGFERCHPIGACLPQECIAITDHSLYSYVFESMFYVTGYRYWHDRQNKLHAYKSHRRFLQHLQWRSPGQFWVLKAPSHLMALEALFKVYPDARVVVTHRDPLKVLPSCASFARLMRAPFTGPIDQRELGVEVSRRWAGSAGSLLQFREGRKDLAGSFSDVSYLDLVREPMAVVARLYRELGRELTPQAQAAMQRFLEQYPKNRFGAHRYSLEEFGLDAAVERRTFRDYCEYFGIKDEAGPEAGGEAG